MISMTSSIRPTTRPAAEPFFDPDIFSAVLSRIFLISVHHIINPVCKNVNPAEVGDIFHICNISAFYDSDSLCIGGLVKYLKFPAALYLGNIPNDD